MKPGIISARLSPEMIPGFALAAVVLLAAGTLLSAQTQLPFDLVITGARIVDGTGAPARAGDVGIRDGRIVRIGRIAPTEGRQRLDATGLVLAPGFIDVHTHADDVATKPAAENFVRMGVTTIVAGNCGTSALSIAVRIRRLHWLSIFQLIQP